MINQVIDNENNTLTNTPSSSQTDEIIEQKDSRFEPPDYFK